MPENLAIDYKLSLAENGVLKSTLFKGGKLHLGVYIYPCHP